MAFPVDKETWTDKVNRDLSVGEAGDMIDAGDVNALYDFLERLEDTLGISFISPYGSLKLKLDDMPTDEKAFFYSLLGRSRV